MGFRKISQQTCFERVRMERILGRVACFPAPALKICSVLSAKCSTRIVSQKAMSDFTSRAGSIELGTDTPDNVQALSSI